MIFVLLKGKENNDFVWLVASGVMWVLWTEPQERVGGLKTDEGFLSSTGKNGNDQILRKASAQQKKVQSINQSASE